MDSDHLRLHRFDLAIDPHLRIALMQSREHLQTVALTLQSSSEVQPFAALNLPLIRVRCMAMVQRLATNAALSSSIEALALARLLKFSAELAPF